MSRDFIELQSVSAELENLVRQDLKFKTGNFIWRIRFNIPLDPVSVNNQTMYVASSAQVPLQTSIRYNSVSNEVEVEPLEPYSKDSVYFLTITKNVKAQNGKYLNKDMQVQFKV